MGADIEARRRAGVLGDDANYRAQLASAADEKQKMLDRAVRVRPAAGVGAAPAPMRYPELTGELHNAVIGFLALDAVAVAGGQSGRPHQGDCSSRICPGTTWQYPNWSRKMRFTVEQLHTDKTAQDFTAMFRHWVERTGRVAC